MQEYGCNEQILEVKYAKMLEFIFIKKIIFERNQQILEVKSSHMILLFSFLKSSYTFEKTLKLI